MHTRETRGRRKYKAQFKMTKEFLHEYFGLPNNVEIVNIVFDSLRDTASIIVRSEEQTPYTFEIGEGQEVPVNEFNVEWLEEATIERFKKLTKLHDNNTMRTLLAKEEL